MCCLSALSFTQIRAKKRNETGEKKTCNESLGYFSTVFPTNGTPFPTILCTTSRKNVLSQGFTLIQVRSFQLPALAHHVSAAADSLQSSCRITSFCDAGGGRAFKPSGPCTDTHASDAKRLKVHEDRGSYFCIFVCKASRQKLQREEGRWREGAREKAKSFVPPLPLFKAEGKCLSQGEVRRPIRARPATCNHGCTLRHMHRCRASAAGAF